MVGSCKLIKQLTVRHVGKPGQWVPITWRIPSGKAQATFSQLKPLWT